MSVLVQLGKCSIAIVHFAEWLEINCLTRPQAQNLILKTYSTCQTEEIYQNFEEYANQCTYQKYYEKKKL